jgi:hypothetical protein
MDDTRRTDSGRTITTWISASCFRPLPGQRQWVDGHVDDRAVTRHGRTSAGCLGGHAFHTLRREKCLLQNLPMSPICLFSLLVHMPPLARRPAEYTGVEPFCLSTIGTPTSHIQPAADPSRPERVEKHSHRPVQTLNRYSVSHLITPSLHHILSLHSQDILCRRAGSRDGASCPMRQKNKGEQRKAERT